MKIKILTILSAFVSLSLTLGVSACGSSPSASLTPDQFGAKYKFSATDIPGWAQDPTDPGAYWTGTDLVGGGNMDGAAGAYTDKGFVQGMYQSLVGPDPQIATVWAMDFGTASNAQSMFNWKVNDQSASIAIPSYDASTALGASIATGLNVFAWDKASYFELALQGLGQSTSSNCTECQVAKQFLDVLKSKTN